MQQPAPLPQNFAPPQQGEFTAPPQQPPQQQSAPPQQNGFNQQDLCMSVAPCVQPLHQHLMELQEKVDKHSTWFMGVGVLIVLLILAAAGFWYYNKKGAKKE